MDASSSYVTMAKPRLKTALTLFALMLGSYVCLFAQSKHLRRVENENLGAEIDEPSQRAESHLFVEPSKNSPAPSYWNATMQDQTKSPVAPTTTEAPPVVHTSKGLVYAVARQDRTGSAVAHMLAAHAYAFHHNLTYAGACFRWDKAKPHIQAAFKKNRPGQVAMIRGMGLAKMLPFRCPDNPETAFLLGTLDTGDKTKLWTESWIDNIKSQIQLPAKDPKVFNIAVHIRRQDVGPCGKWADRYLPNSYYLQQIRDYWPTLGQRANKDVQVTIYSTKQSPYESFDDFSNYTLDLDGNVVDAWKNMMRADVLTTSRSTFSIIPALLNTEGIVVAPTFDSWNVPYFSPRWKKANETYPAFDCSGEDG